MSKKMTRTGATRVRATENEDSSLSMITKECKWYGGQI
jgi:hypothetical protein